MLILATVSLGKWRTLPHQLVVHSPKQKHKSYVVFILLLYSKDDYALFSNQKNSSGRTDVPCINLMDISLDLFESSWDFSWKNSSCAWKTVLWQSFSVLHWDNSNCNEVAEYEDNWDTREFKQASTATKFHKVA